ncbi:MAG: hypothetical protein A2928_01585 [Candidatus Taylorbacteria bacterium RIFCSPLOWO2_01_FULL_45_15b]|uniref:HTH luxR-type domain-containing protein n=1 Tax=Candidatus Taylorbacteria bacterium RIFCSPLOWO2_01_FULL_45_15b TaxID=1802319 RepID=A0A1G2NBR0_9BACT|nr:MAG: hypothetical protein A2928_01585 [Candidatus Taylorbacteria bacterium RIFCSPLOWO2_01_FULL_45_15b]
MSNKQSPIEQEFISLYEELADPLYRRFVFKISHAERSKDLVQETFTKCWEYISQGKEVKNLKAFIYKIANNLIIDEYRKKKSISLDFLREGGFDAVAKDEDNRIVENAERENVSKIIDRLPSKYRDVVTMRYVDGLTPGEIARVIGETENTVSVRINRSIKKMRDILRIYGKQT